MNQEELYKLHGEPVACLRAVISCWLSGKCNKPPTVESLTSALRNQSMKEDDVAATIEQCKYLTDFSDMCLYLFLVCYAAIP